MDFRRATVADLDRLLVLQAAYYRDDGYVHHPEEARKAWAKLLGDASLGQVHVAESAPEVVGYVVITFGYSLEYLGRDAFVDELFVAEPFRGRGLGRRALEVAEAACREAGARAVHLEVEPDKDQTIELYRRRGFVDKRRRLMTRIL
jgi:ribosomal protein S18 acetylase RimI-like enzyme